MAVRSRSLYAGGLGQVDPSGFLFEVPTGQRWLVKHCSLSYFGAEAPQLGLYVWDGADRYADVLAELAWPQAQVKYFNQLYAVLDAGDGLWAYAAGGDLTSGYVLVGGIAFDL